MRPHDRSQRALGPLSEAAAEGSRRDGAATAGGHPNAAAA